MSSHIGSKLSGSAVLPPGVRWAPVRLWLPSCSAAALMLLASSGGLARLRWIGLGPGAIPLLYAALLTLSIGGVLWLRSQRVPLLSEPLDRDVAVACAVFVLSTLGSAFGAKDRSHAFLASFELAAAAALFTCALSVDRERLAWVLGLAALTSITVNAALCLAGPGAFGLLTTTTWPYQVAIHQNLGAQPRFYGLGLVPFGLGLSMFLNLGLVQAWPQPRVRRCATLVALFLAVITFSFCTLLLPFFTCLWIRRGWLRRSGMALTLAAALGALYVHPISLQVGAKQIVLDTLHPGYSAGGRGPVHMPLMAADLLGVTLHYHYTGYYYLARGQIACGAEHPWFGMGGRNAARYCRTLTMNTYGQWYFEGRTHNEYLAMFAEWGVVGMLAALAVVGTVARRYRLDREPLPRYAALLTVVALGMGIRAVVHLPTLLLVACSLRARERRQAGGVTET